ncbi:MAG: hypothetical protein C5B50_00625 [Verrucomicrobia bacterium]|nr:MAG: hypothetical protein C5B50_00625 [Verrucomicrobiota bacterium]
MAKVQIEVDEVAYQQQQSALATLAGILKKPGARKLLQQAQKEAFPDLPIPELDAAKPLHDEISGLKQSLADVQAKIDAEKAEQKAEEQRRQLKSTYEAGRETLRKNHRYTPEGIKKIEEMMEAKGILSHEDGRLLYEALNPPQSPVAPAGFGSWDFAQQIGEGGTDLKKLMDSKGEDDQLVAKMARDALNEFRSNAR